MYKLFEFFHAVVTTAHALMTRASDLDIVGLVRGRLEHWTTAELVTLRESAQTFLTEVEMELQRRLPPGDDSNALL